MEEVDDEENIFGEKLKHDRKKKKNHHEGEEEEEEN